MVCKNCGRQVVPTDRFCPDCGTPVVVEEPVVETVETPVDPVVETPVATKTTRTRKTTAKAKEVNAEVQPAQEKKAVTNSSLLQAISAARNNSKLASVEEVAPVAENVAEPATENVVEAPVAPVVETPVETLVAVEPKEQPKVETPVSNEPFVPTVTSTKQPKGFGVASIIISSIMLLVLSFVIVFAVLLLTANDPGLIIGLLLIGGAFAMIALNPIGTVGLGIPSILTLVFAIIQTVKAKRKLSWVALILAISVMALFAVVVVLTFVVNWETAFTNMQA